MGNYVDHSFMVQPLTLKCLHLVPCIWNCPVTRELITFFAIEAILLIRITVYFLVKNVFKFIEIDLGDTILYVVVLEDTIRNNYCIMIFPLKQNAKNTTSIISAKSKSRLKGILQPQNKCCLDERS